ncbi:MAG: hypothetical protein HDR47_07770 [Bacteroides sp.]|nr:hypothetical protein [Bacteroides sp.]
MADRIVDTGEMEYWAKICSKYSITKDMEVKAQKITLSDALSTIRNSECTESKKVFLEDCRSMTTSDGFCAHGINRLIDCWKEQPLKPEEYRT